MEKAIMAGPKKERRKQPRARGKAGLMVGVESMTPSADIKDISLSGVCFTVAKPLEFMTRLMMTLIFPSDTMSAKKSGGAVQCEGAVVRCEPIASGEDNSYEVAVFFTHLEETAMAAIEEYVNAS
jgi:hypothetical protein